MGPLRTTIAMVFVSAGLVLAFAVQLHILSGAAIAHGADGPAWYRTLAFPWVPGLGDDRETVLGALAVAQTGLLAALFVLLRSDARYGLPVVAVTASALAAIALFAKVTDADVYAYIGYGKLGVQAAYAPPDVPFAHHFAAINARWGTPLLANVYGPLFSFIEHAIVGPLSSLAQSVIANRLLNASALLALLAAFRRLGVGTATLAVCALNPALYYLYVVCAHNDILGIALLAIASAVQRRAAFAAIALVVAAAAVKLSFCIVGILVFCDPARRARTRLLRACASIVASVSVSWAFGGAAYFSALLHQGAVQVRQYAFPLTALHGAVVAAGLVALAYALFANRWNASASWTFATFAAQVHAQYLAWALPYAQRCEYLASALIAFPALGFVFDPNFTAPAPAATGALLVLYGLLAGYVATRSEAQVTGRAPVTQTAILESEPLR